MSSLRAGDLKKYQINSDTYGTEESRKGENCLKEATSRIYSKNKKVMKNLISYEHLNEAIVLPSQPKDAYNKVLAVCKKDSKKCLQVIDTYKASTKEQNADKNMYSIFVKSVMDNQPLGPAEYMGKRFLLNKMLLKLILNDGSSIKEQ